MRAREIRDDMDQALAAARKRDGTGCLIGEIEGYCDNDGCNARYITVTFKELDGPDTPPVLFCPICRKRAKLHHVFTLDQANDRDDKDALGSINRQLYVDWCKRMKPEDKFAGWAIPGGVFLSQALPTIERLQALERGEWGEP